MTQMEGSQGHIQASPVLSSFLLKWMASQAPVLGDPAAPLPGVGNYMTVHCIQGALCN